MKAIVFETYGLAEVLELKEIPKPVPKENEVLIKIHATSINDWDLGLIQGLPKFLRLENGMGTPKKNKIIGSDVAGIVEVVGAQVTRFKVGDAVYGDLSNTWGGFAEYVCAKEEALSLKPESMSFEDAAAIPQAAMLAVQGLFDQGQLKENQEILINGAGGGVGTFGVQLAKLHDCTVTGVDSEEKLDMMKALGFDRVIDYRNTDFTKENKQYDLILDNKMSRSAFRHIKVLKKNGKYITTGGNLKYVFSMFLFAPIIKFIYKKEFKLVALKMNKDLPLINDLYEQGKIRPVIDSVYLFKDAKKAMEYYISAKHKGKIIISME